MSSILQTPDVTENLIVSSFDVSKLNSVILELIKAVASQSSRLDAHDFRLEAAETRLSIQDAGLGETNERVATLDSKANSLSAGLEELTGHVNNDHVQTVEGFRLVEEKIQSNVERIERLEQAASDLLSQTQTLLADLTATQASADEHRRSLDERFATIDDNYEAVKSFIQQEFSNEKAEIDEQRAELAAVSRAVAQHGDALGQMQKASGVAVNASQPPTRDSGRVSLAGSGSSSGRATSASGSKDLDREVRKINGRIDALTTRVDQIAGSVQLRPVFAAGRDRSPDAPDTARSESSVRSDGLRRGAGSQEAWAGTPRHMDLDNTLPSPRGVHPSNGADLSRLGVPRMQMNFGQQPSMYGNGSQQQPSSQATLDEQSNARLLQIETEQHVLKEKLRSIMRQMEGKADVQWVRKVEHYIEHGFMSANGNGDDATLVGRAHFRCLACDAVTPWGAPPVRTASPQNLGRTQTIIGTDEKIYKGRDLPVEALQRRDTSPLRPASSGLRKNGVQSLRP